jgi:hypothetical protein
MDYVGWTEQNGNLSTVKPRPNLKGHTAKERELQQKENMSLK